ncbi:MAG: hypothetical protein JNM56_33335 [Planctomycetia bacterium]|nr:hypothetical protein [Planctomycetia bacterium]
MPSNDFIPINTFIPRFEAAQAREAAARPNPLPEPPPQSGPTAPKAAPVEGVKGSDAGKDLLVMVLGAVTVLAVAAAIYWLVEFVGYPFHAQMMWLVFPIGAPICGLVAGAGFWLALRQFHRRPQTSTYVAAAVAGVLGYVLIYFLMWWFLESQGVRVRDEVGFVEFMQFVMENQRVRHSGSGGEGAELGQWGYAQFAINVAGFAAGILVMVQAGGNKTFCPRCKRYFRKVGKQSRSSTNPEATAAALHPVIHGFRVGRIQEAVQLHADFGTPGNREYWTTTITVEACTGCGLHLATLEAAIKDNQGSRPVPGFFFRGVTLQAVRFPA